MKTLAIIAVIGFAGALALQAYTRLAPLDPDRTHRKPVMPEPGPGLWVISKGAQAAIAVDGTPSDALERFDDVIRSEPRTSVLAGSLDEGLITYVARTAFWGFPDLITLTARPDGDAALVLIRSRQRIGSYDWGVNAARITRWVTELGLPMPPDRTSSP